MSKKGVSELISWVLLVAFVIALGAFVAFFSTGYIKKVNPGHAQELKVYCQDTQIDLTNVCRDKNNIAIIFTVNNKGSFGISRLTINREHSNSSLGSCGILNPLQDYNNPSVCAGNVECLLPGEEFNFTLALRPELPEFEEAVQFQCPDPASYYPFGTPLQEMMIDPDFKVLELSVIPWVDIEGERVACPDKKTQVSANLLNVYCS